MNTQPDVLDTQGQATRRVPYKYERHDELLDTPVGGGERDQWTIGAVLDLFPTLPNWPTQDADGYKRRARRTEGGRTVLEWLRSHPGNGWQERWVLSGADSGLDWVADLIAADARVARTARYELMSGLASVLLCRIVFPSYTFLAAYRSAGVFTYARQVFRPDLFTKLEERGAEHDVPPHTVKQALMLIAKIVLRTAMRLPAEEAFRG